MTGIQSSASRVKSATGGALLALGVLLILFYSNFLLVQFQPLVSAPLVDSLDSCARLGVTFLHALQTALFDHAAVVSIASNMLVLFSAFAITLIGIVLRKNPNPPSSPDRLATPPNGGHS